MLRSIAASKGQLVRKQGELGSPKHESIVSLAETRGFYRQTQPAKCRPCRQESSLILGLGLDQAKPARLGEARNQKNSKSLVFLRRLMK